MMHKQTIAVVVPMYQSAGTILRAMKSIFMQVPPPSEVWLVDDASSDQTVKLAEDFVSLNRLTNWCVLSSIQNMGPAAARDKGVKAATAKYVAFLDADDEWLPGCLEDSIRCMEEGELDLFGAQFATSSDVATVVTNKLFPVNLMSELMKNFFLTSTVVVRRVSYIRVGGFELGARYSEDYRLWLKMCSYEEFRCAVSHAKHALYSPASRDNSDRLSKKHWAMQKAELSNYFFLYQLGRINLVLLFSAGIFSMLRYGRRLIITR